MTQQIIFVWKDKMAVMSISATGRNTVEYNDSPILSIINGIVQICLQDSPHSEFTCELSECMIINK